MSMQNRSIVKSQFILNFPAPGALNQDAVGVEQDIGLTEFRPAIAALLDDITMNPDPAAGLLYSFFTRRLGGNRKRIGTNAQFSTALISSQKVIFPLLVNPGLFNWVMQQTAGALTAQSFVATFNQPLAI